MSRSEICSFILLKCELIKFLTFINRLKKTVKINKITKNSYLICDCLFQQSNKQYNYWQNLHSDMSYEGGSFSISLPFPTLSLLKVFSDIQTLQKDNLNDVPME
jgi:hypothetical protein